MNIKYRKDTQKCPRCGKTCLIVQKSCDECGLVFARLDEATNKNAKKQFFAKEKSIVMVTKTPKDIKRWLLIVLVTFLGVFGAHNLYVGRYYRGSFMLVFGLLSLIYVALNNPAKWLFDFMTSFPILLCVAVLAVFWVTDFVKIIFEKYRIPVALDGSK